MKLTIWNTNKYLAHLNEERFVLISTLALIVILSLLILLISRTLYTDSLKTNVFSNSVEK